MADTIIKFQMFRVVNAETGAKARVFYSLDNQASGRKVVSVYDRDYGHDLQKVFAGVEGATYQNDTDSMTDYFDKGRVRIFEGTKLYDVARAAVEQLLAQKEAKYEAKRAEKAAKRAARYQVAA